MSDPHVESLRESIVRELAALRNLVERLLTATPYSGKAIVRLMDGRYC